MSIASFRPFRIAFPAACLAVCLTACTHRAVIRPLDSVRAGDYRAVVAEARGAATGYALMLNGNGRFKLETLRGGCTVSERRGAWSADEAELRLRMLEGYARKDCASGWDRVAGDTGTFVSPLRNVSAGTFSMLDDAIGQGTRWTEWRRSADRGYAEAGTQGNVRVTEWVSEQGPKPEHPVARP